MNPCTRYHIRGGRTRRVCGVAAALVAVMIVPCAACAAPIWFAKTQTNEDYLQFAFAARIVGNDSVSYDYYHTPWRTPVSFWETQVGTDDRVRIVGESEHMVAVHANEASRGVQWGYILDVIGPPAGPSTYSRAVLAPHPLLSGHHMDVSRATVGVEGDGTGEINGYAYTCIGRHLPQPGPMYAAALSSTTSARIYYGDATLILDESDNSLAMAVALGNADFVELHGAAIRRTEDDAMILDIHDEGNWQDAGGLGIAGGVGFDPAVTFPIEFLPDLIGHNAYVELLVGGDVIRGELTEVQPEWVVIPEPATCVLAALALTALGAYMRRRSA